MTIIYALLISITAFVYFYLKAMKALQMLQLNSYRNERYTKWMSENKSKVYFLSDILPLFGLLGLLISPFVAAIISIALFVLLIQLCFPRAHLLIHELWICVVHENCRKHSIQIPVSIILASP